MKLSPRFLLCLAFLFPISLSAPAAYLPGRLEVTKILPPPPAAESTQAKADAQAIESWQKKRTAADCARARREENLLLGSAFAAPDGMLSEAEVRAIDPLFRDLRSEAEPVILEGKAHWNRPRPFAAMKGVEPCTEKSAVKANYSYPSGHATMSRLFGRVLAAMRPAAESKILARADQVALDRVIAGVHFPSDIAAGKKLGDEIFRSLMQSESFRKRLAEAGAALKQAAEASRQPAAAN